LEKGRGGNQQEQFLKVVEQWKNNFGLKQRNIFLEEKNGDLEANSARVVRNSSRVVSGHPFAAVASENVPSCTNLGHIRVGGGSQP
jgi:hypothetical protein